MKFLSIPVLVLFLVSAKDCPKPVPQPTPVPTPIPTPTPTPHPITSCSFPQGVPEDQFKEVPNQGLLNDKINQVVSEHTGCAINSNCVLGTSDPQFYLTTIINWLLESGLCAGQHVNGQSDEIAVATGCEAGVTWESYHIVNFGADTRRVAWSALRPAYQVPVGCQGTAPPTKPTDPPVTNCPPSMDKIDIAIRDQAAWIIDATPKTGDKDWCNANGFPGRNFCPLGPEGSDSRPVCEVKFGPYIWTLNGSLCGNGASSCFPNGDPPNPLQLRVPKPASGIVKICANNGVCSDPGVIQ